MVKAVSLLFASASIGAVSTAFENETKWLTDDDGNIVVRDGNPVVLDKDGQERTVKVSTIATLNAENRNYRQRAEAAEARVAEFGDLDVAAARAAIDRVASLESGTTVDASKLEELRAEIEGRYQVKVSEAEKRANDMQQRMNDMVLDSAFQSSEFARDNLVLPPDILKASFAQHFAVEDGRVVARTSDGKPYYSTSDYGKEASFDEALAQIINGRSDKDKLLKANLPTGSGNDASGGRSNGLQKTIKRSDFNALSPTDQAAVAAKARSGEMTMVD